MSQDAPVLPKKFLEPLMIAAVPWLSGTHAVTRVMAQLLVFHLLNRIFTEGYELRHPWDKAALR